MCFILWNILVPIAKLYLNSLTTDASNEIMLLSIPWTCKFTNEAVLQTIDKTMQNEGLIKKKED